MITLALTMLAVPQLNAQQTELVNAIIQVESSGNDDAIGDNGKAIGCLQIWQPYWFDATERSNIGGVYRDCFKRDYGNFYVLSTDRVKGTLGLQIWISKSLGRRRNYFELP